MITVNTLATRKVLNAFRYTRGLIGKREMNRRNKHLNQQITIIQKIQLHNETKKQLQLC